MEIDRDKCVGCGRCIPHCPVEAITMDGDVSRVDLDECVECGNCLRSAHCPTDAIYQQELVYPRTVRSLMSDVLTIAEESQISGRGTEEMKTNEVTGRFRLGEAGVAIEVGRPCLGTRLYDVEKIARAVAEIGVAFEPQNPVTSMMADASTGTFKEELLNERVLSAIIEFSVELEQLPELFEILRDVSKRIETVFSLDLATRIAPDGSVPTDRYVGEAGLSVAPNGKTNVGLGRP
ncbi:MAG: 4Fe-4S dicluster domain-containing protein, partial [Anaerolineae bacterium]|nr:4Fe-4S dicluster domain-containing protein [Anaerolineae bacterium]